MSRIIYFAYGSNMNAAQMKSRCPRSKKICIGYMPDAEIYFPSFSVSWSGGVAGYKSSPGSLAWGVIYEIDEQDLIVLRGYENFCPKREAHLNHYNEVMVEIITDEGPMTCMTYHSCVTGDYRPSLRYIQGIIQGAEDNNLPEDYIQKLTQLL